MVIMIASELFGCLSFFRVFLRLSQSETAIDPLQGMRFARDIAWTIVGVMSVKKTSIVQYIYIDELQYEWREKRHMKSTAARERESE